MVIGDIENADLVDAITDFIGEMWTFFYTHLFLSFVGAFWDYSIDFLSTSHFGQASGIALLIIGLSYYMYRMVDKFWSD